MRSAAGWMMSCPDHHHDSAAFGRLFRLFPLVRYHDGRNYA